MTPYILSLLAATLTAAVVELLAPRGDGGRLAAYVRMVAGLILLVALIFPLSAAVDYLSAAADGSLTDDILSEFLPDVPPADYEDVFGEQLTAVTAAEVERWVSETLVTRFSIPEGDAAISVHADLTADSPVLTEVRIALGGASAFRDPHPIEAHIADALGCPCYVTVGI